MYVLIVARTRRALCVVGVFGALGVGLIVPAAQASAASCQRVRTPNVGSVSELLGVSVTSARNAWAVGWYGTNTDRDHPLIEHWNGRAWTLQAAPIPAGAGPVPIGAGPFAELTGVAATSARNAWAVGWSGPNINGYESDPLIEHWNGKAWTVQTAGGFGAGSVGGLTAVAAISARNAWAVGWYGTNIMNGTYQSNPLIEHWNGTAWTVQATLPGSASLVGVAATSSRNVWAVGGEGRSLVEHWNGKAWTVQAAPGNDRLAGVAATSSRNAWAVGDSITNTGESEDDFNYPITEHWNGTAWRNQPGPFSLRRKQHIPVGPDGQLTGVAAASPASAWAVGTVRADPYSGFDHPAVEHWNGRTWTAAPAPRATDTQLLGVATAKSASDAWAVGIQHAYSPHVKTFALHCR